MKTRSSVGCVFSVECGTLRGKRIASPPRTANLRPFISTMPSPDRIYTTSSELWSCRACSAPGFNHPRNIDSLPAPSEPSISLMLNRPGECSTVLALSPETSMVSFASWVADAPTLGANTARGQARLLSAGANHAICWLPSLRADQSMTLDLGNISDNRRAEQFGLYARHISARKVHAARQMGF